MTQITLKTKSLLIILLISILIYTCNNKKSSIKIKKTSFFSPQEKAKVLAVGTFHFAYPGIDFIKTPDTQKIDVLKEPKKSELDELVEYIKKFKPNKIAIEAQEKWNATQKLRKYKQGKYRDKRDERFQLGIRIASELNLDTIYSIDSWSMVEDLYKIDSNYIKKTTQRF